MPVRTFSGLCLGPGLVTEPAEPLRLSGTVWPRRTPRPHAHPPHPPPLTFFQYGIRAVAGGGRSSARETIGRVAAGAVAKKLLAVVAGVEASGERGLRWVHGCGEGLGGGARLRAPRPLNLPGTAFHAPLPLARTPSTRARRSPRSSEANPS